MNWDSSSDLSLVADGSDSRKTIASQHGGTRSSGTATGSSFVESPLVTASYRGRSSLVSVIAISRAEGVLANWHNGISRAEGPSQLA